MASEMTSMKALAADLMKGMKPAPVTREVDREEATLFTYKVGNRRVAEVIRRRTIVRLNIVQPPDKALVAAMETIREGNTPVFAFGSQVTEQNLKAARNLLAAALKS
jgi:hypothetical protein